MSENRKPEPINGYLAGSGNSPYSARADHTHEGLGGGGGDYAPKTHTHEVKDITDIADSYAAKEHTHDTYAASTHQHVSTDITDAATAFATKDHTHTGLYVPVTIAVADWESGTSVAKAIAGVKEASPFAYIVDPADQAAATAKGFAYSTRADGTVTFTATETPEADIRLVAFV